MPLKNQPEGVIIGLDRAIRLALFHHQGQLRKDGRTPYVTHPLRVGFTLQGLGLSEEIVCAGILHDLIEDTSATWDTLNDALGPRVADIVVELSEDKRQPRAQRKALMLEKLEGLSPEAKLVKLADRLDNLREIGLSQWSPEKAEDYCQSTERILKAIGDASPPLASALQIALGNARASTAP